MFFTKRSQDHLCNAQEENLQLKLMEMLLCMGTMSLQTHRDAALHGHGGPLSPKTYGDAALHGQDEPLCSQPMGMLLCMHMTRPFPSPWDKFPE